MPRGIRRRQIRRAAARSAGSPGAVAAAARPPAAPKISGFRCRKERGTRPNSDQPISSVRWLASQ